MKKLVSVIIPVYNSEKYLPRCIDSLLAQDYQNLELILVDDGSADGSPAICDSYAQKDDRVKVIHKPNGGVSSARNCGLENANGEYLTFVDSDDYCLEGHIRALVELIEGNDADISVVGFAEEKERGNFVPYRPAEQQLIFNQEEMLKCVLENKFFTCAVWDKLFKREVLEGVFWAADIYHNEDLLFLYEAIKRCNRVAYCSNASYYYCNNEGSAVHSLFNRKKMTILDVWERILQENPKKAYVRNQFVRVNINVASDMARDGYEDQQDIRRIRGNIRRYLWRFLWSNMALGYKMCALRICYCWKSFVKKRRREK